MYGKGLTKNMYGKGLTKDMYGTMYKRTFVILSQNLQYYFPKMRGGGVKGCSKYCLWVNLKTGTA